MKTHLLSLILTLLFIDKVTKATCPVANCAHYVSSSCLCDVCLPTYALDLSGACVPRVYNVTGFTFPYDTTDPQYASGYFQFDAFRLLTTVGLPQLSLSNSSIASIGAHLEYQNNITLCAANNQNFVVGVTFQYNILPGEDSIQIFAPRASFSESSSPSATILYPTTIYDVNLAAQSPITCLDTTTTAVTSQLPLGVTNFVVPLSSWNSILGISTSLMQFAVSQSISFSVSTGGNIQYTTHWWLSVNLTLSLNYKKCTGSSLGLSSQQTTACDTTSNGIYDLGSTCVVYCGGNRIPRVCIDQDIWSDSNPPCQVNECATGNGGCSAQATCQDQINGFTCTCWSGFSGDGFTCSDVNECANNNGGCDPNAQCLNLIGSSSCNCNAGYIGNGYSCSLCSVNNCSDCDGTSCWECNSGFYASNYPTSTCYACEVCPTDHTFTLSTCASNRNTICGFRVFWPLVNDTLAIVTAPDGTPYTGPYQRDYTGNFVGTIKGQSVTFSDLALVTQNTGHVDVDFDGQSVTPLVAQSFTVEVFARLETVTTNTWQSPITFRSGGPGGFMIYCTPDQTWNGIMGEYVTGWFGVGGGPCIQNRWTHLALRFDASTSLLSFFIDAALVGTRYSSHGYNPITANSFRIGGGATEDGPNGGTYFWQGSLARAMYYNYAVNDGVITNDFLSNNPVPTSSSSAPFSSSSAPFSSSSAPFSSSSAPESSSSAPFSSSSAPESSSSAPFSSSSAPESSSSAPFSSSSAPFSSSSAPFSSSSAPFSSSSAPESSSSAPFSSSSAPFSSSSAPFSSSATAYSSSSTGAPAPSRYRVTWPLATDATAEVTVLSGPAISATAFTGVIKGSTSSFSNSTFYTKGNQDSIDVPSNSLLATTSFSVEIFAQLKVVTSGNWQSPITFRGNPFTGFFFYCDASQTWSGIIGTGTTWSGLGGGSCIPNKWTHLALTYDSSTQLLSFYVDSVLKSTQTTAFSPDSTTVFRIGGGATENGANPGTYWWQGRLGRAVFYNYAIDVNTVRQDYYAGYNSTDMRIYWPLQTHANATVVTASVTGTNLQPKATVKSNAYFAHSAANLQGCGDRIDVDYLKPFNSLSFTTEVWALLNHTTPTYWQSPINSRGSGFRGLFIYCDDNQNWAGIIGNGSSWITLTGSACMVDRWTHLALRYQQSTQTLSLFINGAVASSSSGVTFQPASDGTIFRIGGGDSDRGANNGQWWWQGKLVGALYYNYAVADGIVRRDLNATAPLEL